VIRQDLTKKQGRETLHQIVGKWQKWGIKVALKGHTTGQWASVSGTSVDASALP
jgi:hypothetical protein